MMGYDMNVVVSPQGDKIAWESMERDGYEADKQRLFVMDLTTGEKKIIPSASTKTPLTYFGLQTDNRFTSSATVTPQIKSMP